ncbi:C4-dicarboxylate ABC transporter substrate-binding protein [Modestobacter sp. VKM Ac-2676]|nr:C4-dicarboxylate ABC transporter substrate-binding protein [Modestobacter sp. VKM Ac-2676]
MLAHKRIASVVATGAVFTLTLTGCGSDSGSGEGGGGDTQVFRVAFNQNEAHPQAQAILELSDKLEEQTDGRYRLELFPDGTLGAQEATIEQVQSGTIDFAFVAGSLLESLEPDFSVVNLPYVYESPEHQLAVLNDQEIVGELYDSLAQDNIEVLAAYHGGVRNVYTDKPVETPDDLAGLKIRVIGSDTNVRMMELMGGVGTPMAQDEVYTAIQSGVIDGGENNELIYSSLSHDEIAPYYSYTEHLMMPDYLIASPNTWNSLDDETKEIFEELLAESIDTELAAFGEAVETAKTEAEEAGATFVEADADAFRDAVLPLHDELVTTERQQEIYDAIEAARG